MWWHIVPVLSIMGAASYGPLIFAYFTNMYTKGTPYYRFVYTNLDFYKYVRDMRLSGVNDAYKLKGLENIEESCLEQIEKKEECTCP